MKSNRYFVGVLWLLVDFVPDICSVQFNDVNCCLVHITSRCTLVLVLEPGRSRWKIVRQFQCYVWVFSLFIGFVLNVCSVQFNAMKLIVVECTAQVICTLVLELLYLYLYKWIQVDTLLCLYLYLVQVDVRSCRNVASSGLMSMKWPLSKSQRP